MPRDGRYVWQIKLHAIASSQSALWDFPQIASPGVFDGPTLFIAGAQSDDIRLGHRPNIECCFLQAEFAEISDAGHRMHAEQPDAFLCEVDRLLKRTA